jgi:hypothetical protein
MEKVELAKGAHERKLTHLPTFVEVCYTKLVEAVGTQFEIEVDVPITPR